MAPLQSTAGGVAKKNKGLKDHKSAQKKKALAKRSAAAEKVNTTKTVFAQVVAAVVEETAPMPEVIAAQKDVTATQENTTTVVESFVIVHNTKTGAMVLQSHDPLYPSIILIEDVVTGSADGASTKVGSHSPINVEQEVNNTPRPSTHASKKQNLARSSMLNPAAKVFHSGQLVTTHTPAKATSSGMDTLASEEFNTSIMAQHFDVLAYRKALGAALYESMETPRERLIRCKYMVSIDTEYHPDVEDNDGDIAFPNFLDRKKPTLKCLDDNGFEITPTMIGLTEADLETHIKPSPSSSLCQLSAKVDDLGVSKVGAVRPEERTRRPDEPAEFDEIVVNLPNAGGLPRDPVSIGRLSPTSSARKAKKPASPRTLEAVESEMRFAAQSRPPHAPAFADPGIVRYRIDGREYDNICNSVPIAAPPTHQLTRNDRVLELVMGEQTTSPPGLSPTSSRQSRMSSPIWPGGAYAPVTVCSNTPLAALPAWHIPFDQPSYINPYGVAAYAPGISMNSSQGGFQIVTAQQYAHQQQMGVGNSGHSEGSKYRYLYSVHHASFRSQ